MRQITVNLRIGPCGGQTFLAPGSRRRAAAALVVCGVDLWQHSPSRLIRYCATKFGLRGNRALRRELADTAVQVVYGGPQGPPATT